MCGKHYDSEGKEHSAACEHNWVSSEADATLRQRTEIDDLQVCGKRHQKNE